MIEISDTFVHKFISHFHAPECIIAFVPVNVEGHAAHELAQISLSRIITLRGEFFEHEVNIELKPKESCYWIILVGLLIFMR